MGRQGADDKAGARLAASTRSEDPSHRLRHKAGVPSAAASRSSERPGMPCRCGHWFESST